MNVDSVRYLGVCGTLRGAERDNDVRKRPKVNRELMLCQAGAVCHGLPSEALGSMWTPFLMLGPMALSKGGGLGRKHSQALIVSETPWEPLCQILQRHVLSLVFLILFSCGVTACEKANIPPAVGDPVFAIDLHC